MTIREDETTRRNTSAPPSAPRTLREKSLLRFELLGRHHSIIVGDAPFLTPFPVICGQERGMWWDPWSPGCRRRAHPVTAVVLHHTGAENPPDRMFHNLRNRQPGPLSVHFAIDQAGKVWQFADPAETVCSHAGEANGYSIGIEITSRGTAPAVQGWEREAYTDTVHGRRGAFLRFYRAQMLAAYELCEWLCMSFGLPMLVPGEPGDRARRTVMTREELARFRGVIGHYHVTERKRDPSPHLLDEIKAAFEDLHG